MIFTLAGISLGMFTFDNTALQPKKFDNQYKIRENPMNI